MALNQEIIQTQVNSKYLEGQREEMKKKKKTEVKNREAKNASVAALTETETAQKHRMSG